MPRFLTTWSVLVALVTIQRAASASESAIVVSRAENASDCPTSEHIVHLVSEETTSKPLVTGAESAMAKRLFEVAIVRNEQG